jgi:hypothetical protein
MDRTKTPHMVESEVAQAADDVYEIPGGTAEAEIPVHWRSAASYTLESPARCPHCRAPIRTVRVIALIRTQVNFTSTLPRKGRVIVCPECERILSVELTGLV